MTALPFILSVPYREPAAAFAPFADRDMSMLLESAQPSETARYSYIATAPFCRIHCTSHPWRVSIDGKPAGHDPFVSLRDTLARFHLDGTGPVPFLGGAVGFFSYELGGVLERLPKPRARELPADMVVGLYDVIAAFDHVNREAWVIATGFPETGDRQIARAQKRAKALADELGRDMPPQPSLLRGHWHAETSRADHESRVVEILDAIVAGDIYQANLTQRFSATVDDVPSYALYERLRALSPAPFAAFINAGDDMAVISASPERFLALDTDGNVTTQPIKGTRPRGRTPAEDAALAEELTRSAKDRAENLMIVDLLRNDIARVCIPGSVAVPQLAALESFASVHHLVSTVTGRLRPGCGPVDLLTAAFPGGSITGAPKIRAMEIIHALEPSPRGPYCGAVAWIGFNGAMDSSIVIRTLVRHGSRLAAQAGGGIVADSEPAREYEESVIKVAPLLHVLDSGGSA